MLAQGLVINRARVPADRLYDSHDGRCHQEYAHNGADPHTRGGKAVLQKQKNRKPFQATQRQAGETESKVESE